MIDRENRLVMRDFLLDALRNARLREVLAVTAKDTAAESREKDDIISLEAVLWGENLAGAHDFDGSAVDATKRPKVEFHEGAPVVSYDPAADVVTVTAPRQALKSAFLWAGYQMREAMRSAFTEGGGSFEREDYEG